MQSTALTSAQTAQQPIRSELHDEEGAGFLIVLNFMICLFETPPA
jgi:hypothetical protein